MLQAVSSPAERIQQARTRAGLDPATVAQTIGLPEGWYFDLEHFNSEVTGNISLDQFLRLAELVGLTPLGILEGPDYPEPNRRISLAQLVDLARQQMQSAGLSVDAYSDRVGWEMAPVFADPAYLRSYTVDALQGLCREVGVDWHKALPEKLRPGAG
ncbi:MAG TPA: hypothetical protein VF041_03875 [Gemmatimonadaceae bacterium]